MKIIGCILVLLAVVAPADAKPRHLTVLGNQRISVEYEGRMPLPAAREGITIDVAAFIVEDGKLTFTFGLESDHRLKRVLVDDVTGSSAIQMVDDTDPKREWTHWKGNALPLPLSREALPWVWERGDTTKVFRFTIWVEGQTEEIVLFQPAVYLGKTKKLLQQVEAQK